MKKLFFQLKSESPVNRIGSYSHKTYWTDKCETKKEVKARYNSNSYRVTAVFTEEQFIEKYGAEKAAKIERYWNA